MAETARGNGEAGTTFPTQDLVQSNQLIINAQYIKDLSFENPRAPQSLIQPTVQPEVAINIDVKARNLGPEVFEVVLTVNVTARAQNEPVFIVELAYAAVITVKNTSESVLPTLILVETPRLIFPFARAIVADATRDGGFPPLMINPIDFAELLRRQPPTAITTGIDRV
jgi:preprotein translocase subunit SecB